MATRMKSNQCGLRKITKPVISTDVMGNRNVEVRAVGAWVQPSYTMASEGVVAAQEEEERMKQIQSEKEARLRKFREDVKRRVKIMEKARKEQQSVKTYIDTEHEHRVVRQSAFSENVIPRRDSCLVRKHIALTAKKPNSASLTGGYSSDGDETNTKAFSDQTNEVHKFTSHARKKLGSKQVITDDFEADDLPGGIWKISKCRDNDDVGEDDYVQHPVSRHTAEPHVIDLEDDDEGTLDKEFAQQQYDDNEDKENEIDTFRVRMVHFDLEPSHDETRQERIKRRSAPTLSGSQVHRNVTVPNIYAGVHLEQEKKLQKLQQATYRRLFMDIEREQVKENLRRQEHRKKIQKLKKEKEEQRRQEEEQSYRLIEPRDPITGESSFEALQREIEEHEHIKEVIRENEERIRKVKEMERFVEALKQQLKEKMHKRRVELPPLCCCGDTLWDTNPETCANNCVFYKNHRGYAKALQSLLISTEIS